MSKASSRRAAERGAGADPGLASLTGRWLRPDGGYVLDVRAAGGGVEATYLNPRPIHVAGPKRPARV